MKFTLLPKKEMCRKNDKKASTLNAYQKFKYRSYALVGGLLCAPMARADSDMVNTIIRNISQWLSGSLAVSVGILVIAYSGYEMTKGRLEKDAFIYRMAGIGMVIGSGYFGNKFFGG
ncbi:MAG: hypothetical protein LEGION0398_MBIBDBAK_00235 [Legionellaceae bacterium]